MITKQELKLVRSIAKYSIAAGHEITLEIGDKDYKSKALNGGLMDTSTDEQRVTLTTTAISRADGVTEPMPQDYGLPEDENDIL